MYSKSMASLAILKDELQCLLTLSHLLMFVYTEVLLRVSVKLLPKIEVSFVVNCSFSVLSTANAK